MTTHRLRQRLEALEARPLSTRECVRALRRHRETGELPTQPRLREVVERAVAFAAEVRERRRLEDWAESIGARRGPGPRYAPRDPRK